MLYPYWLAFREPEVLGTLLEEKSHHQCHPSVNPVSLSNERPGKKHDHLYNSGTTAIGATTLSHCIYSLLHKM